MIFDLILCAVASLLLIAAFLLAVVGNDPKNSARRKP
jgi:hypothetical protein